MIQTRLHILMGERRLKITTLAEETGIAYTTLHPLYHGQTKRIDFATVDKLCKVLHCRVGDLLEYVPDNTP